MVWLRGFHVTVKMIWIVHDNRESRVDFLMSLTEAENTQDLLFYLCMAEGKTELQIVIFSCLFFSYFGFSVKIITWAIHYSGHICLGMFSVALLFVHLTTIRTELFKCKCCHTENNIRWCSRASTELYFPFWGELSL